MYLVFDMSTSCDVYRRQLLYTVYRTSTDAATWQYAAVAWLERDWTLLLVIGDHGCQLPVVTQRFGQFVSQLLRLLVKLLDAQLALVVFLLKQRTNNTHQCDIIHYIVIPREKGGKRYS